MSIAETAIRGFDLRALGCAVAPGSFRFDPWGLVTGYKSYVIYSDLQGRSDAELAELGLTRAELPRAAVAAAGSLQNA